jgi:hypothetical protein
MALQTIIEWVPSGILSSKSSGSVRSTGVNSGRSENPRGDGAVSWFEQRYVCGCLSIRHRYHDGRVSLRVVHHDGTVPVDDRLAAE